MKTARTIHLRVLRWGLVVLSIHCFFLLEAKAQFRYLTLYANGDIRLLIVDPQGRRLGYDPKSNTYFEEIPRGNIGAAGIDIVTEEGGEADPSQVNPIEAMIPQPLDGNYVITVLGSSLQFYDINVRARHVNTPITNIATGGIIDSGLTRTFRFVYDFNGQTQSKIEPIIQGSNLIEDVETSYKMGLLKNHGVYSSFKHKAENAAHQHEQGQNKAGVNILEALVNELKSLDEKNIDPEATALLLEDAQTLIKQWTALIIE